MTLEIGAQNATRPRPIRLWIPPVVWTLTAFLLVAIVWLSLADPTPQDASSPNVIFVPLFVTLVAALATVGALLSLRRAENPIGWMLLAAAPLVAVALAGGGYSAFAVHTGRDLSFATWAAWVSTITFEPGLVLVCLVVLVFPAGALPRNGWRIVAIVMIGMVVSVVAGALAPDAFPPMVNPTGVAGMDDLLEALQSVGNVILLFGLTLATISLVTRLRAAHGDERKQLEWFAYVAGILLAALAVASLQIGTVSDTAWAFAFAAFAALPIAIAVAIMKYRLYGIDTLISRTLVYVPLVAILGGIFAAGIALFQRLFLSFAGDNSDAAVVVTTLIVAGTFTPMRKSLESAVDRNFRPAAARAADGAAIAAAPALDVAALLDDPRFTARMEEIARRVARQSSESEPKADEG